MLFDICSKLELHYLSQLYSIFVQNILYALSQINGQTKYIIETQILGNSAALYINRNAVQ